MAKESNRVQFNAAIPRSVYEDLDRCAQESGMNKKDVLVAALKQYLTIKHEEDDFRRRNPGKRVKVTVRMEAISEYEEPEKIASVLVY